MSKWHIKKTVLFLALLTFLSCGLYGTRNGNPEKAALIAKNFFGKDIEAGVSLLELTNPYDETVFPPEIAAPTFTWKDSNPLSKQWLVQIELNDRKTINNLVHKKTWTPDSSTWEVMKLGSTSAPAMVTIIGFKSQDQALSMGSIRISTSQDRVDAHIFYRQVPLPFQAGERNFRKIKWRLGDIASYEQAPVVMENIPVCASCHQFSKDGSKISMEMNLGNDSGAQFVAPVSERIRLSHDDFMTWSDYPKPELLPDTRGLFARLSPSGRYIAGTVNEISYAALTNDAAFCQLFFPTYGVLAYYFLESNEFSPLNGADDINYIQTNPAWSPDEKTIAFARSKTKNQYHEDIGNIKTHIEDLTIHELNQKFPIQFDIYNMPFNNGAGGRAEPLQGASDNGMSNYFPRYSPDGKWMVYTRSKTGIMLQPDSELYIVPANGGKERRMTCNQKLFNSWHSWSPNSRWLLFSSKVNSMYTEIFLTHIDGEGNDSPPVCLNRFSHDSYAANLPEFVKTNGELKKIVLSDQ